MMNYSIFGERISRFRKPLFLTSQSTADKCPVNQTRLLASQTLKKVNNNDPNSTLSTAPQQPKDKSKKLVRRKVKRNVETTVPKYKPKVIPNLPDKILWIVFDMLDYKNQCKSESVCRRWQRLIRTKQRREIHELCVEMLGSTIHVLQQKAFKRLSITCPHDAYDFLSGVMRRSHTLLKVLTCDFNLLANVSKLAFKTDGKWKYFSGVEQLWIVVTKCSTSSLLSFKQLEETLFTELANLTIQIHLNDDLENVGQLMQTLVERNSTAEVDIELHANSCSKIVQQLEHFNNLQLNRLKIVCSALDAAPLFLTSLVEAFQKSKIKFKKIVFLEWYLNFDHNSPIVTQPVQLLHINSCSINRSKEMIGSLYKTMTQRRKKAKPKQLLTAQQSDDKENKGLTKTIAKTPTKKIVRKKVQYIKKMEMAGSINCSDLLFLASKQHLELEELILREIPDLIVDSSDIYYFE